LLEDIHAFKKKYKALFLAFPGDEDRFGGCLSSGRGFAHIAPDGRLEACPFAPFGDTDARNQPLREALRSPLLEQIRAHHDELSETSAGCALWNRREWAESLVPGEPVLP
jgi:MoaA/NifB/PqqE/SkfB family radical SAM enzyme